MITILLLLISCGTMVYEEPVVYDPVPVYETFESMEMIFNEPVDVDYSHIPYAPYDFTGILDVDWELCKPSETHVDEQTEPSPEDNPVYETPTIEPDNTEILIAILLVFLMILATISVLIAERNKKRNSSDM